VAPIVHWDELERERGEEGDQLASYWTALGRPAGSVNVGVNRIEIDAGKRSTPLHREMGEEEIFFVLDGSGLSWQHDGEQHLTFEVRAGDCLVHLAGAEAHSLVAGRDGLDVLAFGAYTDSEFTFFPRLHGARMGPVWIPELETHQWTAEAALGSPDLPDPSPRPSRIVNVDELPDEEWGKGEIQSTSRELGVAAGSKRSGISYVKVAPGKLNVPPHCHSAEEEVFVVLDGEGVCLLGDEEHPVRRGHVVARPAGTRVAHAFRAGNPGLELLTYGTREPNDIAYYPRSNKLNFRGVGVITRLDRLDYWDGEA
jgi:uncharacterized cupin superfamily protein